MPNEGPLFHMDSGSNCASNTFISYLNKFGVTQSLFVNSFFAMLKREELYRHKYAPVNESMLRVNNYMDYYNAILIIITLTGRTRRYQIPDGFEAKYMRKQEISM